MSANARAEQLRSQLAQLYGDIGALSQSADSVNTLQGGVVDGAGRVFDPSNMFEYRFTDGALTSINYLDPRLWPSPCCRQSPASPGLLG
ncbi:Uncharacterised protein [Mycobacteroides abscessus subsp. abscessus]|nr:Uncharacterised protein [Mycobacteroides abscessus subsp. abscessus]